MNKRVLALLPIAISLLAIPLPGFTQSGLCSDPRSTGLVKRVYRQALDKFISGLGAPPAWANEIDRLVPVEVKSVRTLRIDQGVGRHHCEATLEAKLTAQGTEAVNNPLFQAGLAQDPELRGFQTKGSVVTHAVRYTVQLTDDKKEIHVQATGHQNLADLVYNVTIREVNDKMTQSPKPEPKPAPVPRQAASKPPSTDTVEKSGICKGLDRTITADNNECIGRMYEAADGELNKVYKEVMASLDKAKRGPLLNSQRAWIKEKETKCEQEGEEFKGGSIAASIIANCKVEMTQKRVQFLKAYKP